jgi:hypothetical protein
VAVTLDEANTLRAAYMAALQAVATGQSYTIGTRTLTRADAVFIAAEFAKWDRIVTQLQCNRPDGVNVFRVVPRDL